MVPAISDGWHNKRETSELYFFFCGCSLGRWVTDSLCPAEGNRLGEQHSQITFQRVPDAVERAWDVEYLPGTSANNFTTLIMSFPLKTGSNPPLTWAGNTARLQNRYHWLNLWSWVTMTCTRCILSVCMKAP